MTGWARYLTPAPAHWRLGLVCLGVGAQHGVLPSCGPRVLSSFAAVLITSGRGWLAQGPGRPQEVTAPALFWLRPGRTHRYGPDEDGWAERWVLFAGPAAHAYLELGYLDDAVGRLLDPTPVYRSFARIAASCRGDTSAGAVAAAAAVHDLLVTIDAQGTGDDPAAALLAALRRDAHLPLSVAEHARRLGTTTAELREQVRLNAGFGPKEFLVRSRLSRAKQLLASSDLPVAGVGRRVGYADPGYFTRVFTRYTGMAPARFRAEQHRHDVSGGA